VAVFTRFYRLGEASFWLDEVFTVHTGQLPWSVLWITPYDPTPPLFFSVVKLATNFGESEWWYRLPSAVAGVLTVFFIYLTVRKLAGIRSALAAALLLALSIGNIEYSQEARAYALASMFVSISFLGLVSLNERWRESDEGFGFGQLLWSGGALYVLGTLGALYSHNTAVFYWLGTQVFFCAWWIKPFRFSLGCLAGWFVINFVVLLLWLPWFTASLKVRDTGAFTWLENYPLHQALDIWGSVHGPLIPILGLLGLYYLRHSTVVLVLLGSLVIFSSVVIWGYGFVERPVLMPRTLLWGTLFTVVLAGIAIGKLPGLAGNLLLLGLLVQGAVNFRAFDMQNTAQNENWRAAAEVFTGQQEPQDILFFRTLFVSDAFLYYVLPGVKEQEPDWRVLGLDCRRGGPLYGEIAQYNDSILVLWSKDVPDWKYPISDVSNSTVWLVEGHCTASRERREKSDAWLAQYWRLEETYEFRGVTVYRLEPRV
jgi:4-amino-4-deoxy-L-arabinose transferase-like glycosyltransferase